MAFGSGTINYAEVESVAALGGTNGPELHLISSSSGVSTSISSAGIGTYVVGPDLSLMSGTLSLASSVSGNTLIVNDTGIGDDSYSINFTSMGRTSGLAIPYWSNFKTATLNVESGNNAIDVSGVASGVTAVINGGDGNDTCVMAGIFAATKFDGGAGTDALTMNTGSGASAVTLNANTVKSGSNTLTYANIESLALNMQGGNDTLTVNATNALTPVAVDMGDGSDTVTIAGAASSAITYAGGLLSSDQDTLNVNAGTFTFAGDAKTTTAHLALNVGAAGAVIFSATQHLASLSVAGTAQMTSGGTKVLETGGLTITGSVDLADNSLIENFAPANVLGEWTPSGYTGVTGMIARGRNGGTWNGTGIITSMPAAQGAAARTSLGIASASAALGISQSQTAIWNGETVAPFAVLVRYIFAGDANLDGIINGDDYFNIDAGYSSQATGYSSGDFNYDGRVDADDYFLIDANYGHAQSPPVGGAGVEAFAPVIGDTRSPAVVLGQDDISAYRRLIEDGGGG